MLDRRTLIAAGLGAATLAETRAAPAPERHEAAETIELWPAGAPGLPSRPPVETIDNRGTDARGPNRAMQGVVRPRVAVFRPTVANGAALLIAPGGGYVRMAYDKEGNDIARWFAARGWTAFVLLYRLPGDGWAAGADVVLSDAQRAMRLIRARAGRYGVRADRVAAMGFSAGGHLCGDLATRFAAATYRPVDAADAGSARPDIAAPIYAVQSMRLPLAHAGSRTQLLGPNPSAELERAHSNALNVSAATPPCFLVHAEDDRTVDVTNTIEMRAALKAAGVPVETHLFAQGGHGFAMRDAVGKPAAAWPELFLAWARSRGFP